MAAEHVTGAVLILLLLTIASPRLQTAEGCTEDERRALLAVKSDMYDRGGRFSSWTGRDCCRWTGVACDNSTGRHVTKLDLHDPFGLDGDHDIGTSKVNLSLFKLKHLKYLDLSMNDFGGSTSPAPISARIPRTIASLIHLEYLNLSNARFTESIPPQLGNLSSLRFLDLRGGYLKSDNLDWLSRIPSLKYLDMSGVYLSGATSWLHQINSIHTLQVLLLAYTDFPSVTSPLPPFNLTSISRLDLSSQKSYFNDLIATSTNNSYFNDLIATSTNNSYFNDSLLRWLSNGSSLEYLYLGSRFSNPNMETLRLAVAALSNLKELDLSGNDIHGEISGILRDASRRLEHLDLSWNSLTGDVPRMLGDLTRLRHLNLQWNHISGTISPNLWNLVHLELLDLSHNHIGGRIPWRMENLTNLVYLSLSDNNVFGRMPESLGNLYNLKELHLSNNQITGEIPETFGKLKNLKKIYISRNQLSGQILRMAGHLCNLSTLDLSHNNIGREVTDLFNGLLFNCPQGSKLQYLYLYDNNFSGMIPSSLGHLSQLKELDLSSNSLGGNITEAHFTELANLDVFNISSNSLNVILPNDWHPPFNAKTIDMSFCHVRGKLSDWVQTQSRLEQLLLTRVGLSGDLPDWFSDFISKGSLKALDLSSNNLTGLLPSSTAVKVMDLSHNSFVGPIPLSLLNFPGGGTLSLSDNNIVGTIPSLCNINTPTVLDLSRNHLHGEFPSCHGSFQCSLYSLHLNNNHISGPIPFFLAFCQYLEVLDLGENNFSGEIPTWLGRNTSALQVLRLKSNKLHGIIPANLVNLTSITVLDLSFNKLYGSIPSSIGNLSFMIEIQNGSILQNTDGYSYGSTAGYYKESIVITAKNSTNNYTSVLSFLTSIDLSNNNLSGKIPEELTNLLGLHFLNLSNNHLIGSIPESIGAMKQLESLDLSRNNLTGAIPSSLSTLSFLESLNLSYNNLSGRIPKGNQLQTFNDPSVFAGNKDLCGLPLPECPGDAASSHPGDEKSEDKLERILNCAFIVMGFAVGFWVSIGTIILNQSIRVAVFRSMDELYDWIYVWLAVKVVKRKPRMR